MPDNEKSYKDIHGTTRMGDLWRFVKKKAPHLIGHGLNIVGNRIGVKDLGEAIGLIEKDKSIDPLDKEYMIEQLRIEFEEKKLIVQAEENRLKDVADSRKHGQKLSESHDKFVRRFKHVLAILVVSSTLILLLILIFFEVPEENRALLNISFGSLFASTAAIISYYFGTSQSSTDKNKTIENLRVK